jgi:RND superfamily putative drug exporter
MRWFDGVVQGSTKRPRLVLAACAFIVAVAGVFAFQLDGALTAGGFEDPDGESATAQHLVEAALGDEPNQVIVTVVAETDLGSAVDDVAEVLEQFGATTTTTPADRPELQSADGRVAAVIGGFGGSNSAAQELTPRLQEALDELADVSANVSGQPALDYQLNVHSKEDALRAELIVFPALIVILMLVFRSVVAAAVPLVLAGGALVVANGIGFAITRVTDISILYSNIVSMIGLAVAVDYSLFIIRRYRDERASGLATQAALRTAYATAGRSVLFSGIAVAVALMSLLIPGLMAFTSIALGGIAVTVVALLLSITALPAALTLLGDRIAWGTLPWFRPGRMRVAQARPAHRAIRLAAGLAAIAIMLIAVAPIAGISLQSPVASAAILPADDRARIGLETARRELADADLFPIQVVVAADPGVPVADAVAEVERVAEFAAGLENVAVVTAITRLGLAADQLTASIEADNLPAGAAALWGQTGDRMVSRVLITSSAQPDSVAAHDLVRQLREFEERAGLEVLVSGATAQGLDFDDRLLAAIPWIVGFVFALTFGMLAVAFRSVLLPVLALAFNTLVVGSSLGVLTVVIGLTGSAPINSVTPVLLFAVMFGLSMDYLVIIISRIVELSSRGASFHDAVDFGVAQTRGMVNSAALIMVAVFAAFSTAQISIVREIGIGLALAILLDALVIRTLVMPVVFRLVGPRILPRRTPHQSTVDELELAELERAVDLADSGAR